MKVFVIFCATCLLLSCGQGDLEKRVADLEYMFLDYDLKNYDIETTEYPESWRV